LAWRSSTVSSLPAISDRYISSSALRRARSLEKTSRRMKMLYLWL
jgi:hypothetical protein